MDRDNSELWLRVLNQNLFFLFLNQNMCCGYSKEPSQRNSHTLPETAVTSEMNES